METSTAGLVFSSAAQRAAYSFMKAQANWEVKETTTEAQQQSSLHAFFKDLYASIYQSPQGFGLPLTEDQSLAENESNSKEKKQVVKKLLDKPRSLINAGLDFLMLIGQQGTLEGQALYVDGYEALVKQSKVNKKFLEGLESLGMKFTPSNGGRRIENTQYPPMMPALKTFAVRCAAYGNASLGKAQFARCAVQAEVDTMPPAMELFYAFEGAEAERIIHLHEYFTGKGYKTEITVTAPYTWLVQYQGNRKVKASPLFQVGYDDRYTRPMRVQIKCASTGRIAPLLPGQSQELRDDFMSRVFRCQGDKCGWCRNKTTLGPTKMTYRGEEVIACWYSNPDVAVLDDRMVALIKEYEQMHARLVPE